MATKKATPKKSATKKPYVIIRAYSAGVHIGYLASRNKDEVVLTNTRRIYSWSGRFTLSEISQLGVGTGSRLSVTIPSNTILGVIEIIPCAPTAINRLTAAKEYQP